MTTLLNTLRTTLLTVLIVLTIAGVRLVTRAHTLVGDADALITQTQASQALLVRKATQLGDDSHRVLLEVGLASMEARRAAATQRIYWDESGKRVVELLTRANTVVSDLGETNAHLRQDADALAHAATTALAPVPDTITQARVDLASLDRQLNNPDLNATLAELHGTATDVRKKADSLVAPPTKRDAIKDWLLFAARMLYYLH